MFEKRAVNVYYEAMKKHLEEGLIPFWARRGVDGQYGGYLTNYDRDGVLQSDRRKAIVTQARMVWGFSVFHSAYPAYPGLLEAARQGVDFLIGHFWDAKFGGWAWMCDQAGHVLDNGKVTYGQGFMIYALAQYGLSSGDPRGLEYAGKTFDLLQKYAADTHQGAYYENMEEDWSLSQPGYPAGDRKSLDIHMHLLEAFTTLYQLSGQDIHKRKLNEVIHVILEKMVDHQAGCGRNQFDAALNPIPPIAIRRTWNDDRGKGEVIRELVDTTSYGHNLELAWLLERAGDVMGDPSGRFDNYIRQFADHALRYGFDHELGGVYRDGPHEGAALVRDKEWWQNCESLVGFLCAWERLGDERFWQAFEKNWDFDSRYLINHQAGEWHQLADARGKILIGDLGNLWKGMYHSGRAVLECVNRLRRMQAG